MPNRVLLMARELNLGGSERQMTETARFLDRDRFEPRIGCFLPSGVRAEELRQSGIPVVEFPVRSFASPAALTGAAKLARYIRTENIALVHAFDFPLNVFAIPVTRILTRAVAVSSQRSHRDLVPAAYRRLLRGTDRLAHAVVVNCGYLERHMLQDEKLPPDRVRLCRNGIDLASFQPRQQRESGPLVLGTVSGLWPWKGLATLLEAFAMVRPLQRGVELKIVGSGSVLNELQAQARALNILDAVEFQPGTAQVAEWLRKMDIFVLPSLSEALSNALMEAMACGCCVVASNVGGNPELVRHGQTGMLFEAGNAGGLASVLTALMGNECLRVELAANGQRLIRENYSIQAAARTMGDIYSQLIAASPLN